MQNSTIDTHYSEKYNDVSYRALRQEDAKRLLSQIHHLSVIREGSTVLDAGCGAGEFGKEFMSYYRARVYGIDSNEAAVRQAGKIGLTVKKGYLERTWPYASSFFDSVGLTSKNLSSINT